MSDHVASEEHPTRILVSSARKPVSYIPTCKRLLADHGEVQLSGLGIAVSSVVTVAEILKNKGLAVERRAETMLETFEDDKGTRQKPKIEVALVKSPKFDEMMAAEAEAAKKEPAAAADEA